MFWLSFFQNVKTKAGGAKSRAMPGGLLPPPPGGAKIGSPQSPPLTPPNTVMRELPLWSSSVVLFGHGAPWDGDRCEIPHKQFEPVRPVMDQSPRSEIHPHRGGSRSARTRR